MSRVHVGGMLLLAPLLLATPGLVDVAELDAWFKSTAAGVAPDALEALHYSTSAGTAPTALTNPELATTADFKLIYMALRGLGDLPQLCLEVYGLSYAMLHVGAATMKELKPLLPFGRVPLMIAKTSSATSAIAQSGSIIRLLHQVHVQQATATIFPPGHVEPLRHSAEVDMWYEQVKESFGTHQAWGKAFNVSALRDASGDELDAAPAHYRETRNRGVYSPFEMSIVALRTFEEQLSKTGALLTGAVVTYADLALFLQLWELLEEDNFPQALTQLRLPRLRAFVRELAAHPKVASFLARKRMPRNGPFDGTSYPFKPGRTELPEAFGKEEL